MRSLKTEVDECTQLVQTFDDRIKRLEEMYSFIKEQLIQLKQQG